MKRISTYLLAIVALVSFSNCANGKQIQEEPPVVLEQAYYTTWVGGAKGAGSGLNLFIPVKSGIGQGISMDSVYFHGRGTRLVIKPEQPDLYIGYFETAENQEKAPDLIMSSDPMEEYGNRPPEIVQKFLFDLEKDEAVVKFTKNGKSGYFRISGIYKKDDSGNTVNDPLAKD